MSDSFRERIANHSYGGIMKKFIRFEAGIIGSIILLGITAYAVFYTKRENEKVIIDDKSVQIADRTNKNRKTENSIKIPGFNNEILNELNQELYLQNPKDNDVYIQYNLKENNKIFYKTDFIEPGKMVKANIYKILSQGVHEVEINLSTKDIITGEKCNGVGMSVKIEIK